MNNTKANGLQSGQFLKIVYSAHSFANNILYTAYDLWSETTANKPAEGPKHMLIFEQTTFSGHISARTKIPMKMSKSQIKKP